MAPGEKRLLPAWRLARGMLAALDAPLSIRVVCRLH